MRRRNKVANELKRKFAEIGDMPKELVTSYSRMVLFGNFEFTVENYSGIIEYELNKIRLKSASGVICVLGENLTIGELDTEDLFIKGKIKSIEFEGD